ncbi:hypothetical protein SAY86_028275 [Trapa natans]|uniref:DRBM domain-containing protein n=1 Tax=Trapa natans TaxID=22666 RepID=A0AAN7R8H2_TRANT|nr:hypothetical protein SAY86_028275 [Trapa natans]
MPSNGAQSGVSSCYVFKSRLQEYAQKAGLPTPVYETIKEGPSHEPSFKSAVIVNDIRYDSLPGFFNRKAAEQSAAEVALLELSKSGEVTECISQPVHETGLCKNLLQEYAQKMNYAIPLYVCQKYEMLGRRVLFTCTVEVGGIRYVGTAAGTKKEAEIKAARTALIAIRSGASESSKEPTDGGTRLTVIPCKKRGPEMEIGSVSKATENSLKPKNARIKKKASKRKLPRNKFCCNQLANAEHSNTRTSEAGASSSPKRQWAIHPMSHHHSGGLVINGGIANSLGSFCRVDVNSQNSNPWTQVNTYSQLCNAESASLQFLEADRSSLLFGQQAMGPMRYPQVGGYNPPGGGLVINGGMVNSADNYCINNAHSQNSNPQTLVVGNSQLDNTGNLDPKFLEVNGFSLPIEQQTMDPLRLQQVGGSSIITNEVDNSEQGFHHHSVNSTHELPSTSNIIIENNDAPAAGMSSIEYRDTTALSTKGKEEHRANEACSISGGQSDTAILETSTNIILAGTNQPSERIQAGAN